VGIGGYQDQGTMLCIAWGRSEATVRHAYNNEAGLMCERIRQEDRGSFMCCHSVRKGSAFSTPEISSVPHPVYLSPDLPYQDQALLLE